MGANMQCYIGRSIVNIIKEADDYYVPVMITNMSKFVGSLYRPRIR
jgi:hypothetical protein